MREMIETPGIRGFLFHLHRLLSPAQTSLIGKICYLLITATFQKASTSELADNSRCLAIADFFAITIIPDVA